MEIRAFCDQFFSAHYIPLGYVKKKDVVFQIGVPAEVPPDFYCLIRPDSCASFPAVLTDESMGMYGIVKWKADNEAYLCLGPAFSTSVSQDMVRLFMKKNIIPHSCAEDVFGFLSRIPQISYNQFLNLVSFIHFVLNEEDSSILRKSTSDPADNIASSHQEMIMRNREEQKTHDTYLFEMQMLAYVRQGNPEGLRQFLFQAAAERDFNAGIIGDTPLRQAKNVLLGLISLVGKTAAIRGGMDVEQAYQLMDSYSLECERQPSVEKVTALQFQMLIDFAAHVQQNRLPADFTPEMYACVQYIQAHINEQIHIDDLAEHIQRSRSYVTTHFRAELGMSVAEYVNRVRVQESKNLLRYTSHTLSEISVYLCFANQPHFQRAFKKATGMTPSAYRKTRG